MTITVNHPLGHKMDAALEKRIKDLEFDSAVLLGRVNGLASLLVVMGRNLPPDVALRCAAHSREVFAHVEANLLASALSDTTGNEMRRVFSEGIAIFDSAANGEIKAQ